MTAFVESCVETIADSALAAERRARKRPRAKRLLKALAGKKNILVTTHVHPDPDALASAMALTFLLQTTLPNVRVQMSFKGRVGGGINDAFTRHVDLNYIPWDDGRLALFDAVVLLDTQPISSFSPLPTWLKPTAVIDHHRGKARRPKCPFVDIRTDVGAASSIVFSYFKELEIDIPPKLGAALLYAIETDLAGAAGTPGELDNIALSNLTLIADTHTLYQMRYIDLPQSYYQAYATGLQNAIVFDSALISHLNEIDSLEKSAVLADFLLRYDPIKYALVTAVYENRLVMSLRCNESKRPAADLVRRLLRNLGEGGGHRTKAGGFIAMISGSEAEIERFRKILRRRLLRALRIKSTRGQKLVI